MKNFLQLFVFLAFFPSMGMAEPAVKVACVGDSITYGYLLSDREKTSYPSLLQRKLGEGYLVRNFGVSSKTILTTDGKSIQPYVETPAFTESLQFRADLVILMMGANDSKPNNWATGKGRFREDFQNLLSAYTSQGAEVFVCLSPEIHGENLQLMSENLQEIIAIQKGVADERGILTVDLNRLTHDRRDLFLDGLHPNEAGAAFLASHVEGFVSGLFEP